MAAATSAVEVGSTTSWQQQVAHQTAHRDLGTLGRQLQGAMARARCCCRWRGHVPGEHRYSV